MKYEMIDNNLFQRNRTLFMQKMVPKSIAIFFSNDEQHKTADQNFPFKQNTDLLYLSGIDQAKSILILIPNSPVSEVQEYLFIKKTDELTKIWDGNSLEPEEARAISGIENVHYLDEFNNILPLLINRCEHIYLTLNEHDRFKSALPDQNQRKAEELKKAYPLHNFMRAYPILQELRVSKHEIEIELIKKACSITKKAFLEVLKLVSPGINEYEIEAAILYNFLKNGASRNAFDTIVASGINSCILHYTLNNQVCKDGDILLMDYGAEYANYASDMSRTIPVNGRFTKRQKELYNAVLNSQKECIKLMRVGMTLDEYNKEAAKIIESALIDVKLLNKNDVKNQNPKSPLYKQYFMHGVAHFMGLDVHDTGDRYTPLEEGAILTCEPGIYVREEKIGIRLENDILITENGPVDLMGDIPIEAEEIEELMN
ncbi:MAG: aminopeptidase P family protein [Chitinophagaceae bacterium]|nr:MAG: aminopeptidase P family protein [Chitinophagaceae bacterium]